MFQRNELRVERRGRGLKRGKWRSRGLRIKNQRINGQGQGEDGIGQGGGEKEEKDSPVQQCFNSG